MGQQVGDQAVAVALQAEEGDDLLGALAVRELGMADGRQESELGGDARARVRRRLSGFRATSRVWLEPTAGRVRQSGWGVSERTGIRGGKAAADRRNSRNRLPMGVQRSAALWSEFGVARAGRVAKT